MASWLNGHGFEQTPGDNEGQRSLVCYSPWGCRVSHNLATEQQKQLSSDAPCRERRRSMMTSDPGLSDFPHDLQPEAKWLLLWTWILENSAGGISSAMNICHHILESARFLAKRVLLYCIHCKQGLPRGLPCRLTGRRVSVLVSCAFVRKPFFPISSILLIPLRLAF